MELPDASCENCQRIINGYEWTVGRRIFGDFRIRHNIKSKRSKTKRPSTIDVEFQRTDGSRFFENVNRKEYHAPLFMYKFGQASILRGLPSGTGIFEWLPYAIVNSNEGKAFVEKHRAHVIHRVKMVPVELARTLAKIAHSFAVAELGWGSFNPIVQNIDTILCKTDDVAYTVGGDMELKPPIPDAGHLTLASILIRPDGDPLLVVDVRLFASIDTPNFHVVVGSFDLRKPRQRSVFQEKMSAAEFIANY